MAGPHEDENEKTDQANCNGVVRLQLGPGGGDALSRVAAWRDAMAPTAELVLTPEEADVFTAAMTAWRLGDLMAARVSHDHVFVNTTEEGRVWERRRLAGSSPVTDRGAVH